MPDVSSRSQSRPLVIRSPGTHVNIRSEKGLNLPKCPCGPQGFSGKAFISFPLQLVTATALESQELIEDGCRDKGKDKNLKENGRKKYTCENKKRTMIM